jgi:hypothetical protein
MPAVTAAQAREKVIECMDLAAIAREPSHRIMLRHIAETWERIALDMENHDARR